MSNGITSPKVATYDLQPEMSAPELAKKATDTPCGLATRLSVFELCQSDMVGTRCSTLVKAVETTDSCLEQVMEVAQAQGYAVVVIADHGNADLARNPDGSPHTAHTTNPVPIWVQSPHHNVVKDGILADVAPTILALMGIEQPAEMTASRWSDSVLAAEHGQLTAFHRAIPSALVRTHW